MKYNPSLDSFIRGMRVRYVPGHAKGDINHKDCEDGTVSSTNDKNVFVKFDKQVQKLGWSGTTSQSCSPTDLFTDGDIVPNPVLTLCWAETSRTSIQEILKRV